MAYELVRTKSIKSTAAQTSNQFRFQKIDSNGQIALCGSGQFSIGVLQDKPAAAGDPGAICYPGDITKVVAGGSFSAGDNIMSDGSGKAVVATSGSFILGIALAASGADGAVIPAIYQPRGSKL